MGYIMSLLLNDGIIGAINSAVVKIVQWFYSLLFQLIMWLKQIFDFCYNLIRQLAGLETYYYKGVEMGGAGNNMTVTGDIIEILLRSDVVRNLFISLLVLGVLLLFIVTFVSIWKVEWSAFDKDTNSRSKILNSALKALFNFIAVPTIAFFGIFVGNALLRAIDSATGGGGNGKSMSNIVMSSLMINAVRADNLDKTINLTIRDNNLGYNEATGKEGIFNLFNKKSNGEIDVSKILEAFSNNDALDSKGKYFIDGTDLDIDVEALNKQLDEGTLVFSFENKDLVALFFDVEEVNYILGYIVLITMLLTMLKLTYGLVKRLFVIVILFIVSPPIVAFSPINSKIIEKWRSLFVGNVAMAYVTIAIYNIFLSIYQLFDVVTLFPNTPQYSIVNSFVSLLFVCVGLLVINEIQGQISELFIGKGNDVFSQSTDKGKSLWGNAFGLAGKALSPATLPVKAIGKATQYTTTGLYKGVGAAFNQAKADAKGTLTNAKNKIVNAGPLSDLWKNMKVEDAKKGFVASKKMREDLGIKDTHKAINAKRKQANEQVDYLANRLMVPGIGLQGSSKSDKAISNYVNNVKNSTNYKNQGIIDALRESVANGTASDQDKDRYLNAQNAIDGLSSKEKNKLALQHRLVQAYEDQKTLGKHRTLFADLDSKSVRAVRAENGGNLSRKSSLKQAQENEAITKLTATKDAIDKKLSEKVEEFNKIAKQQASGDKEKAKNDLLKLRTELTKFGNDIANTKDVEKLDKKIESLLKKLNK